MDGYFNFGFSNSFRKTSSRILAYKNHMTDETKSDSEWNCDSIERSSLAEIDTDLDSDSFLSDLEKDSGENRNGGPADERKSIYSEMQWDVAVHRTSNEDLTRKGAPATDLGLPAVILTENKQQNKNGTNLLSSLGPGLPLGGVFSNHKSDKNCPGPQILRPRSCCWLSGLDSCYVAGLCSLVILIISLVAPYWLVSWEDTKSPLIRLGPWEACFKTFQFPVQKQNKTYEGCYPLWGSEISVIRGWLLPSWFLVVEATLSFALSLSISSRCLTSFVWVKRRRTFPLRHGARYLLLSACLDLVCGLLLFVSTITFAASCWSQARLFPHWNYSYLSWGWAAGLVASWAHCGAAGLQVVEAKRDKKRKLQNENFLRNLSPPLFSSPNS
eukprot:TRINITY_DN46094_c0_g1_i1.p1 TRINITY_DN46094_c0_g1~~TRINITY_DN46094_c0_g1_i1.p1  ORF type:complete len:385 (-),score=56.56 TRINITY_DN46094_c0_g1_i1:175-1329(-)